jgi:hypothetical protein
VLETDGSWACNRHGQSEAATVTELGMRVHARTGRPPEAIARALRYALDEGLLSYSLAGGRCSWAWADDGPTASRGTALEARRERAVTETSAAASA